MDLTYVDPKDILDPDWFDTYERNVEVIWLQLVRLNSSILLLEKISKFPFDLLDPSPFPHLFWDLVQIGLVDSAILVMWRVSVDTDGEGLTLAALKNQVIAHIHDIDLRYSVGEQISAISRRCDALPFKDKVRNQRNNYIAHFNIIKHTAPSEEDLAQRTVFLEELRHYCDAISELFAALCFGNQRGLYPLDYEPKVIHPKGADPRTDIEKILDLLAKDSIVLNYPEADPESWQTYRESLTDDQLQLINAWRIRFALPAK